MWILPFTVLAQKADTVKAKPSYWPTGIRVGMDVIGPIRTAAEDDFGGYEFNADVDFYRYYLTVEAGGWERQISTEEELYSNSGNYFRVGVDVNFLLKDPDKNMFFFGMRYGRSAYAEDLAVLTTDPVFGTDVLTYSNTDMKAGWAELTTGLRVRMWKFFWMGYTARFKFGLNTDGSSSFVSYDVPGYGKTWKETTWGFNYQLLFRIPIRKEK
jgi:hypothetical protein